MHSTVQDIRNYFINELVEGNFTIARDGSKTIELLGATFIADEPAIFGEPNREYIEAEIKWYQSESTNINKLAEYYGKSPVAWQHSANQYGEINSNYGKLIYSDLYDNQFANVVHELRHNKDSRRACMIYNRPTIWSEYNEDDKNDFICTNAVAYYIRNNRLHAVVQMRSNDVVFGYKNDWAWQRHVLKDVANCIGVEPGTIYWNVQNLHVYERHFHLVTE